MKDYAGYLAPYRPLIAGMLLAGQTRQQVAKLLYAIGARGAPGLSQEGSQTTFSGLIRHMEKRWSVEDGPLIDDAVLTRANVPPPPDEADIDDLGLPSITRGALSSAGITTVGALRKTPNAELLRLPNLARTGLKRIRDRVGPPVHSPATPADDGRIERMIRRVVREEIRSLLADLMRKV